MPSANACSRSAANRAAASRDDLAAAGAMIEIFQDHPRVEQRGTVLQDQHRNLADRVLPPQWLGVVGGVGLFDLDIAVEPQHAGCDRNLAAERRGGT